MAQARSVLYNLMNKRNQRFRFKLMAGFYKPQDVPKLRKEDMASDAAAESPLPLSAALSTDQLGKIDDVADDAAASPLPLSAALSPAPEGWSQNDFNEVVEVVCKRVWLILELEEVLHRHLLVNTVVTLIKRTPQLARFCVMTREQKSEQIWTLVEVVAGMFQDVVHVCS